MAADFPPFDVDLRDLEALNRAATQTLPADGLEVASNREPALFSSVALRVRLPADAVHTLQAQVVNRTPTGFFIWFGASAEGGALKAAVVAAIAAWIEPGPSMGLSDLQTEPDAEAEPGTKRIRGAALQTPAWELIDNRSDAPLHKQLKDLTVAERIRYARQANRPARRILIHDLDKRVHMEVVQNPQSTVDELVEYAGLAGVSPQALRWMSKQGRLLRRRDLVWNLTVNPGTPQDAARMMMDRMSQQQMRRLVKSPRARDAIKREARRKLMAAGTI